jgi:hypothetical protein
MTNMKWNCWNGPAHGAFRPEAEAGELHGPWVGELAGEVGDSIWSPAKEEAHQRVVSVGA